MNILTFDIEDWYNCDFISTDADWDKFEVRIYDGVERILEELDKKKIKATFFCLGWIAEKHPDVIRWIHKHGHHVGCHTYKHELLYRFDKDVFKKDTEKSKKLIEDLIGQQVNAFRAPGFSVNKDNLWVFDILSELDFTCDASIFPATHDYGGFPEFGISEPVMIDLPNGAVMKEFPMTTTKVFGKSLVFSGGGFFRLFPYQMISHWAKRSPYLMTYFHTRDFDPGQPVLQSLPRLRKFKSYVGLSTSFNKFSLLLDNFNFISISEADKSIDWNTAKRKRL
jgi:polysaccharide deacetylase family protein (PEP-CTERM system associated)